MQTTPTTVTSSQVQSVYQTPSSRQIEKVVVTETSSSLNQPQSARFQPKTSTTPSYSPYQPDSVQQTQANQRKDNQEMEVTVKNQEARARVQMADKNLAANVLTGEYSSNATQRSGTPNIGSYLAVSV